MNDRGENLRLLSIGVVRLAFAVGLILMIPLIAMQFSDEVRWNRPDFVVAGALLFGASLVFLFAMGRIRNSRQRLIAGAAIFLGIAWLWVELAVGLFTDWGS